MKKIVLLLCFLLAHASAAEASIRTVLSGPDKVFAQGETVDLQAWFLNRGESAEEFASPKSLECTVSWEGGSRAAVLENVADDEDRQVPASGFSAASYRLRLPDEARGAVVVRLQRHAAHTVVRVRANADLAQHTGAVPVDGSGVEDFGASSTTTAAGTGAVAAQKGTGGTHSSNNPITAGRSFHDNFSLYEPMYFIYGGNDPASARFQLSFKYRVFNDNASWLQNPWWSWVSGVHFAYTQTSLWDWESDSAPFIDSSYKPEFFWIDEDMEWAKNVLWVDRFGLQAGMQHESNGRDGSSSRSMNFLYVKPLLGYELSQDWYLRIAPKFLTYIGDMSDNEDLSEYRGYGDLNVKIGQEDGWELALTTHMLGELDKNSYQFDLTYPLNQLVDDLDLYLHAQYFTGYGMSLLNYDRREDAFRIGFAVSR